jgi:hypothetical protein
VPEAEEERLPEAEELVIADLLAPGEPGRERLEAALACVKLGAREGAREAAALGLRAHALQEPMLLDLAHRGFRSVGGAAAAAPPEPAATRSTSQVTHSSECQLFFL